MSEPLHDASAEAITLSASSVTPSLARKERFINGFALVTQFFTWPFVFIIFRLIFSIRVKGRANFKAVKSPFIIVSNHISFYDSFLFRLALGAWTPHLPLRFMAVNTFDWRWLNFMAEIGVVDFVYSLFGVFTVVLGRGIERNLEEAREIIKVGGNVVIYPEGSIMPGGTVGSFKKGAAVLARQTGVSVIPMAFRFGKRRWLRRQLSITIGGPMNMLAGHTDDEVTQSFHRVVLDLFEKEGDKI